MNFLKPPVSTIVEITPADEATLIEAHDFIVELISFMRNNNYDIVYGDDYDGEFDMCRLDDLVIVKDTLDNLRNIHRLEQNDFRVVLFF